MEAFNDLLKKYDYHLPKEHIAGSGVEPRHNAKLLVYNTRTDEITDTTVLHLAKYVPNDSLIVLNDTQVLPVRLVGTRDDGKTSEIFVLANEIKNDAEVPALLNRKSLAGTRYMIGEGAAVEVLRQDGPTYYVKFLGLSWKEAIEKYGTTPLPHYIESVMKESEARERYQTVFAHESSLGSVAAPTASLHLTSEVFKQLEEKNIQKAFVTLHVGRGTFAPLKEEHVENKRLHKEWYSIPKETIALLNEAEKIGREILAVGTTATRTLESFSKTGKTVGETDIFIMPPHAFTYPNMLMTNFHLPKTSLMMLVDAFLQYKNAKRGIIELYEHAIKHGYRFYSFGDGMLII